MGILASSGGLPPTTTSPVAMPHITPCSPSYLVSFVSLLGQSFLHTLNAHPSERAQSPLGYALGVPRVPRVHRSPALGSTPVAADALRSVPLHHHPPPTPHSVQLSWDFSLCFLSPGDTAGNRPWAGEGSTELLPSGYALQRGLFSSSRGRDLAKERIHQRKSRSFEQKCVFSKSNS